MKNQLANRTLKPEDLMEELGIKKDTYYRDVNFLNIEVIKDDDGKTWITQEDADRIKALRKYVEETGKRQGFEDNEANLIVSENNSIQNNEDDIYVTPDEPTDNMNIDGLVRKASELKAREIAMPELVTRAIADKLTEEQLPEDLQQKIRLAREAANPKYTPSMLAEKILERYRQQKAG